MALHSFIARQPIVDGKHRVIGYELLFRNAAHAQRAEFDDDVRACIDVISNTLFNMGTEWLLKGKLAFINMDREMLMSDIATVLPPEKVVIEVLESVRPEQDLLVRLGELKEAGFRLALDDFTYRADTEPLLEVADYVKFDILDHSPADVARMARVVRRHPVKLVAEKVEKQDQFTHFNELGFDLFQGYYFAHPENLTTKVFNPTQATVLQLMEQVRREADARQLEEAFKRDVALTFKLLRYINSVGFGLTCEVQSIRHAIAILGYRPLNRWLSLLLATASASPTAPALTRNAVTRGRVCELLGAYNLDKTDQDNLFITGVFSVLDALLESPMEDVLERINIPETIADALLSRTGLYGPILSLAEACESQDADRIQDLSDALILSAEQVNDAHLKALAWVEQLGLD